MILKIVATNICGSDQHMVRGRATAPAGPILGHEITGEVVGAGPGVEFIKKGDLVSCCSTIACGRCRTCKEGNTGVCLNVNPGGHGSAYGYVDIGAGSAARASPSWCPTPTGTCSSSPTRRAAISNAGDGCSPPFGIEPAKRSPRLPAHRVGMLANYRGRPM